MRATVIPVGFLLILLGAGTSAQFDRMKAEPLQQIRRNVEATVKALESSTADRDGATEALLQVAKSITFSLEVTRDVPGWLNDGGLPNEAAKVKDLLDALGSLRDRGVSLHDKVKRVGESFSSELSSYKSAFSDVERRYADANEAMLRAAGRINKELAAMRRACPACLTN
jgi:hypothetical protein